jgi:hydroxyethylthiazole kinase-like uncharacterized protein yjeF
MRIVDVKEIKEIELSTINEFKFTESLIIECVGLRGADFIEEEVEDLEEYVVSVVVGKGNNGADALAIARQLHNRGYLVHSFLLYKDDQHSAELKKQVELARSYGVSLVSGEDYKDLEAYFSDTKGKHLVIDGILGTGFKLPLSDDLSNIFNTTNINATTTFAVDIPSGVEGTSGKSCDFAIDADYTMSIAYPKTGHFISQGPTYTGELIILDVGFPNKFMEEGNKFLLGAYSLPTDLLERDKTAHKNSFGHTLLLGGSSGFIGAIVMASTASLKVGTGLVTAATWEANYQEFSSRIPPEIMTGIIDKVADDQHRHVLKDLDKYDSIVIGPGLGRGEESRKVVLDVLDRFKGPIVVDADAINVLSLEKDKDALCKRKYPTIFTPHFGEIERFSGTTKINFQENPFVLTQEITEQTCCSFVVKGANTYIGIPGGEVYLNNFTNDGMATGGSGDVLAGALGGFLAQQRKLVEKEEGQMTYDHCVSPVCLSVMLHSMSGAIAASEEGEHVMSAQSLIENFPTVFSYFKSMDE